MFRLESEQIIYIYKVIVDVQPFCRFIAQLKKIRL